MAYAPAQLSYLVSLGMQPDAGESDAELFARSLSHTEAAEFERISIELGDFGRGGSTGDDVENEDDDVENEDDDVENDDDIENEEDDVENEDDDVENNEDEPDQGVQRGGKGAGGKRAIKRTAPKRRGRAIGTDVASEVQRALAKQNAARRKRAEFIRSQAGDDIPADLVQRALEEDWSRDRVSREFLRAVRTRPKPVAGGHVGIISRSHAADCTMQSLQGAMLLRAGFELDNRMFARREASAMLRRDGVNASWLSNLVARDIRGGKGGDAKATDQLERARDNAHRYASLSMVDFCREALRLSGRQIPDDRDDMIRRALSTASLPAIFSTSINMQILDAYLGIEDSTRGWCFEADVENFMQQERGRMTKASGMKKLARGDEAQQIKYSDETEQYKIARYAGQFTVDEQDIIDDRFGGISQHTPRELGELAAELRPNLVYAILLANAAMRDGTALFHADHGNVSTGAALSPLALAEAKRKMATQTENGRSIRNAMRFLIVPEALEFTARQLVTSAELRNQAANSHDGTANPHHGQFTVVTDPRLDNGVTDPDTGATHLGSVTTWFGAANASSVGIEVGYRSGTGRAPRMETFQLTGARWGMGWKLNMDIGAKAIDWRGLHKATA